MRQGEGRYGTAFGCAVMVLAFLAGPVSAAAAQEPEEQPEGNARSSGETGTPAGQLPATLPFGTLIEEDLETGASADEPPANRTADEDAPTAPQSAPPPPSPLNDAAESADLAAEDAEPVDTVPPAAIPDRTGSILLTPGALAGAYRTLVRNMAGLAALSFRDPEHIRLATRLIRNQDPHAVARGWFTHHAILAANHPAYFAAIRAQARSLGESRFLAWMTEDRSRLRNAPGYDATLAVILEAINAETRRMAAMGNLLLARALDLQSTRLGDAALFSQVTAANAESLAPKYDLSRQLDPSALSPRSRESLDRIMEIAALLILGKSEPNDLARMNQIASERRMDFCVTEARLNFSRCIAATRHDEERAFCIGRHGVEQLGACWRGLLTQTDDD